MSECVSVCECVHTNDLAVHGSRDAGQSGGELKDDVVDDSAELLVHQL